MAPTRRTGVSTAGRASEAGGRARVGAAADTGLQGTFTFFLLPSVSEKQAWQLLSLFYG